MNVLELPQRPQINEPEPPLPPVPPQGSVHRGVLRLSDEVLDRIDPVGFGRALASEAAGLVRHPLSTAGALARWANGAAVAAGVAAARAVGGTPEGPLPLPGKDRRFGDKVWSENALFFWLLQHHLLREQLARELVEIAGLDEVTVRKARTASQLIVDALAPTNFFLTNPVALRRALESGGLSAARGLRKWLDDVRTREGWPRLVDRSGFEVGKNMAATPGKVVYRNRLIELIQYTPQTPEVHAIPLLCSPPFINKYYIMDLAPGRSFIEWAVKNGHTTFCISYRNPDAGFRDVGLGEYLMEGPMEALRVVKEITGAQKVNVAALCVGGTLATMLAAYLAATGDRSINSLTLMNTLVDFSEPGPLGAYTDRPTVERMLRRVNRKGLLEAHEMARTFNLLRANDLYFNYFGSAWMMGDEPPGFDLLAWNDDGVRVPARLLTEYLHGCYLDNALARDEMTLRGQRLRLSSVTQDTFIVGAVEDHITPWRSAFRTTSLLGGKVEFVLSSSGHIAGVVNPPSQSAAYWLQGHLDESPEAWHHTSTKHTDTWWHLWVPWIEARAGERRKAPTSEGSKEHPPIGEAPGLYVTER
ncbi:MAG TPA: alpha/beta fold hydrolase [Myxococcaceae bacterium]|nr:alpha/beta fold hydrolase [Myxococcaceae bacterium]